MIRRIAFIFVVFLVCGICTSATAADSDPETEIPEIFTLHHFLSREDVKNWMTYTANQVAETDQFLQNKKDKHEIAVARLKDGLVTYQCDWGSYGNNNNHTGYLCCDRYLYDNGTWAIYSINCGSFIPHSIKHNVNATALGNYWRQEINHLWADPTYLEGTALDGKILDHWCCDEYQNEDRYICYTIAPRFRDSDGNTWEITVILRNFREPDRIEEGGFYRDLSSSSAEIDVRVIHERYALPIDYNEFALGPIVYHY